MSAPHLPPLATLRALEAAVRLGSFSRAAEALHVTHGAISQHIRSLEAQLGVPLFERHGKRVRPNETGLRYAARIATALAVLREATDEARCDTRAQRLIISAMPSFTARWLMPRIGEFIERHPHIDVELRASPALVDFDREDVDLALRHGRGDYPGLYVERLFDEHYFPVCAPHFNGGRLPATPLAMLDCPLLHSSPDEGWDIWLDAAGLSGRAVPQRGPRYMDSSHLLDAAIAGQGIALVRHTVAMDDLKAGRLVRLFRIEAPAQMALHLVCPPGHLARARASAFRDWLLASIARFEAAATTAVEGPPRAPRARLKART